MTVARETQDEAAEVMRCLRESLRESALASALVQLLAMNKPDVEHNEERPRWR